MAPGADAVAQARALLGQLRTLAAQHDMVLAAYERQIEAIGAGGAAKLTKLAPIKRPPPLPLEPEGPEQKKQRMIAEQQQRRNSLWHECYKVLDRCRRNQKAEAFKKPVDPIRMKIPDYPQVIKNPMDLQTVGEKLKLRSYKDPGEFAADMRLVWDNAQLYNGRNHPVGLCAIAMSEFFEKAWGPMQIEKQWAIQLQQEEMARQALEGKGDGLPNSDLPKQLKDKRDMLGHYIAARDFNEGLPPGALGPCDPSRQMCFEEKRKLSAHLASLPGEKMQRVVDIVDAGMQAREGADPEGELELDIDELSDAVLWQLKEYVDSVLAPPSAPPKKGGAAKGGAPTKQAPDKRSAAAAAAAAAAVRGGTPPAAGAARAGTPSAGAARGGTPPAGAAAAGGATPPGAHMAQRQATPPVKTALNAAAPQKGPSAATPPLSEPTASQQAMAAPGALGAVQQPPPQQPGSPHLSLADSAHDIQDFAALGQQGVSTVPSIPGDGLVAQSGLDQPAAAFIKSGEKDDVSAEEPAALPAAGPASAGDAVDANPHAAATSEAPSAAAPDPAEAPAAAQPAEVKVESTAEMAPAPADAPAGTAASDGGASDPNAAAPDTDGGTPADAAAEAAGAGAAGNDAEEREQGVQQQDEEGQQ